MGKAGRKPNRTPSRTLYVRIDEELGESLDDFVKEFGEQQNLKVTLTAHIERALREYLAKYKDGGK